MSIHPLDVEESIIALLEESHKFQTSLRYDLGIADINTEIEHWKPKNAEALKHSGLLMSAKIDRLSSEVFIEWNYIMDRFPSKLKRNPFRVHWRNSVIARCMQYLRPVGSGRFTRPDPGSTEIFLFPFERNSVPILYSDTLRAAPSCQPRGHGSHLIVLVHGYQGTTSDMRLIRNMLACVCPEALIFSSSANEGQTDGDIETMGVRLSMELTNFLSTHSSSFSIINRISFIGHSLGGLIVRAAIPLLGEYKDRMYAYISLATPHLGISNKLIENGIALLRWFKKAELLEQLTFKDSPNIESCYLFRLSHTTHLDWFQRVVLVGSWQDQYSPLSSSTLSPNVDDRNGGNITRNILTGVSNSKVVTIDVDFDIDNGASIDAVIGRAAHIKFLESPILIQTLLLANSDMFDIYSPVHECIYRTPHGKYGIFFRRHSRMTHVSDVLLNPRQLFSVSEPAGIDRQISETVRCRRRHVLDSLTASSTIVTPLLNYEAKSHAFDILSDSIRSVGSTIISHCVYSTGGKSGHHTWGLCTRGAPISSILSTTVFRKFRRLGFVELTYIATAEDYRRDGFGSYLLKSMLNIWQGEEMAYVFTFADFGAVKFFENNGFSRNIPVPRDLYDGWIDKYSNSVLMCRCLTQTTLHKTVILTAETPLLLELLVYIENVAKYADEIWVNARVLYSSDTWVGVQYSIWLRNYAEVLPLDSPRIRFTSV